MSLRLLITFRGSGHKKRAFSTAGLWIINSSNQRAKVSFFISAVCFLFLDRQSQSGTMMASRTCPPMTSHPDRSYSKEVICNISACYISGLSYPLDCFKRCIWKLCCRGWTLKGSDFTRQDMTYRDKTKSRILVCILITITRDWIAFAFISGSRWRAADKSNGLLKK